MFLIENNLYGEYTALPLSTPVHDLATRADSYAMRAVIVDGQDVEAVMTEVGAAVERARAGGGPTLVEAKTYRYSGHSRSDAGTYRPPGELDAWLKRDPITLYAARLVADGVLDDGQVTQLREQVAVQIAETVQEVLVSPEPAHDEMFRHVWA